MQRYHFLNHLTAALGSGKHQRADDALGRARRVGTSCATLPDSDPIRPPVASHGRSSSSDLARQLGDLYLPTRLTHQPHPRPRSTCPYPSGPVLPPGTSVRAGSGKRWMLAYWAPVWKIPGSWGTRSAAWGSWSRWSHVHALGGRAASEEQRPTCLPHPRPACVRRLCLVLAVRCGTLAVGARGRWAVVNRSPPAHSKWLPRPTRFRRAVAMGYQGGCHGLPDRGSGSVRGMAGACGLLSRGPRGWGLSYKEGPGKRRDSTRDATQSLPALAASTLLFRLKQSGFCGNFCSLVFFSPSFLLYLLKRSLWILKEKGHELAESVQLK